jgi:hypothetical protein
VPGIGLFKYINIRDGISKDYIFIGYSRVKFHISVKERTSILQPRKVSGETLNPEL